MNYSTVNGVKDIQVLLKEAAVYTGKIDGVWGTGTRDAVLKLFHGCRLPTAGGQTTLVSISAGSDFAGAKDGIMGIQSNLKLFQLYTGAVDGLMGPGTFKGFYAAFVAYRKANKLPVYDLGWSKRVPGIFTQRVKQWCDAKGYWANAAHGLMGCMSFESGNTFSPSKQNNGGAKYFGLIQFGDAACQDLAKFLKDPSITLEAVKAMSQMDQLELVFKYFAMWESRGKVYKRMEDFYLTIFYPAAVGKGPDEVLFTKNSDVPIIAKSYLQNNGFDLDKDGAITVGEICTRVSQAYYDGLDPANRNILSVAA
jgi:hypothetical protein